MSILHNNSKAYSLLYPTKEKQFDNWSQNQYFDNEYGRSQRKGWRQFIKKLHGSRYEYHSIDQPQNNLIILNKRGSESLKTQEDDISYSSNPFEDKVKKVLADRKRNKNMPLTNRLNQSGIVQYKKSNQGKKIKLKNINESDLESFKKEMKITRKQSKDYQVVGSLTKQILNGTDKAEASINLDQSQQYQALPSTEPKITELYEQQEVNGGEEDPIKKIIQLAIERGLLANDDENNYLLLTNNLEYYLHQLNLCKCNFCSCGKCMCYHPRARMQGLQSTKEEKIDQPFQNQLSINPELYDNLSISNSKQLRNQSYSFSSTYKKDFQRFSIESPQIKQISDKKKIPFLGQSSYRASFVNWKNYDEAIIYRKPKFNHTGDCPQDIKSTYHQYHNQLEPGLINQLEAKEIKGIQNQQLLIEKFIQMQLVKL